MKIFFLLLLFCGFLCGCSANKGQLPPEDLFVVNPGELLTIKQQSERLEYARLLRLIVVGDSLRVPEVSDVPLIYKEYAEAFAGLLNRYLRQMDESDRQLVLSFTRENNVENAVLGSYVRMKEGRYELNLSKSKALKIGLSEKRYEEVVVDVRNVNQLFKQDSDVIVVESGINAPTSVFFNHSVLSMVKNTGMEVAFRKSLEQLKVTR